MKLRVVLFILAVCLSIVFFSCRRNQPSLIDANRPPDTELWYAPLDSTEYEWNVHMYWRGLDFDGIVVGYIWTITDTLEADPQLRWNPAERRSDLESGTLTTRTDDIVRFVAYKNVAGVGLRKNRQAFHIAAIDDNGVIDPTPAVIEFVATVGRLPHMRFHITYENTTKLYNPEQLDTVGMYRPFSISYRGFTENGLLTGYKFKVLSSGIPTMPGEGLWYTDLSDTVREFVNEGAWAIPSSISKQAFRVSAQCRDQSGAESPVDTDANAYREGVVQIVVNYDPDTEITHVDNTYFINQVQYRDSVNFRDEIPDTVPYGSWVRVDYRGWDDSRDIATCTEGDHCISYYFGYTRRSRISGSASSPRWFPPGVGQDTQVNEIPDSNSKNIGTWDYNLMVRAIDEQGRPDGTTTDPITGKPKSEVLISGNFPPTMDTMSIRNYDGATVSRGESDTLVWDWNTVPEIWDPDDANYRLKTFYVEITATGHDHWKETKTREDLQLTGVVNWQYDVVHLDDLTTEPFFYAQGVWRSYPTTNAFTERFSATYRYHASDPGADSLFASPPQYWNSMYEVSVQGRDCDLFEYFPDYLWYQDPVSGISEQTLLNSTNASESAMRTEIGKLRFFLKVKR